MMSNVRDGGNQSESDSVSSNLSRSGEDGERTTRSASDAQAKHRSEAASSSASSSRNFPSRYLPSASATKADRKELREQVRKERAERRARRAASAAASLSTSDGNQSPLADRVTTGTKKGSKSPAARSSSTSSASTVSADVANSTPHKKTPVPNVTVEDSSSTESNSPVAPKSKTKTKSKRPASSRSKASAASGSDDNSETTGNSLAAVQKLVHTPVCEEDFIKLQLIGRGAVGHVYVVEKRSDSKLYAMKVLDKREMVKHDKVKRALTEREILATADHPFIVTLYWSFMSKEKLFFIMDYCAGGEFFRMLQTQPGKCLPESAVRFYTAEVLLALEYLHFQGFVYRDLKPENILMHASGHIMLTDFDLSKQAATNIMPQVVRGMFDKTPNMVSVPELSTISFVGTTEYIAPEVIKGFGQSSAVDWWTFGVLTYEMLFSETPFKAKDSRETLHNILTRGVKVPKENYHGKVSRDCRHMIKKLLHLDQKKRLGGKQGAQELKTHDFYSKVNFALIRNERPPIVPNLSGKYDTKYFRANLEERELSASSSHSSSDSDFDDFSDINRRPRHPGDHGIIAKKKNKEKT